MTVDLLQCGLTHSHSPFRSKSAPVWPYPWPQSRQGCTCSVVGLSVTTHFEELQHDLMHYHVLSTTTDASSVWSCPWATIPSEAYLLRHRHNHGHRHSEIYLLRHGLIHGHRGFGVSCSHVESSTGHSPFDSSSRWSSSLSRTAAQKQQRCPGHLPAPAHHHCCYQNVPGHNTVR